MTKFVFLCFFCVLIFFLPLYKENQKEINGDEGILIHEDKINEYLNAYLPQGSVEIDVKEEQCFISIFVKEELIEVLNPFIEEDFMGLIHLIKDKEINCVISTTNLIEGCKIEGYPLYVGFLNDELEKYRNQISLWGVDEMVLKEEGIVLYGDKKSIEKHFAFFDR